MRLTARKSAPDESAPWEGQQWEYMAVQVRKGTGDFDKLNTLGEHGWELVGSTPRWSLGSNALVWTRSGRNRPTAATVTETRKASH
jgi:hypothetical protein